MLAERRWTTNDGLGGRPILGWKSCPSILVVGLLGTLLLGCDRDGDGWDDLEDCGPDDPRTHPGAAELCGVGDEDCDGAGDGPVEYFADLDGDGFGAGEGMTGPCAITRRATVAGDCNDLNPRVHPQAPPDDCAALDPDCDTVPHAGFSDLDGDGVSRCNGDCDDQNPLLGLKNGSKIPPWLLCDGLVCVDGVVAADGGDGEERDSDGDGYMPCSGDCADTDPSVHPFAADGPPAEEDGIDQDCNREADVPTAQGRAWATIIGDVQGEHVGTAVATLGDLDGDGLDEVLVGAAGATWSDAGVPQEGSVSLFLGSQLRAGGALRLSDAWTRVWSSSGAEIGAGLLPMGDLDGDGVPELVIGSADWAPDTHELLWSPGGRVWVHSGARLLAGGELEAEGGLAEITGPGIGLPLRMAAADMDGDGVDDLLLGGASQVSMFSGAGLSGQRDLSSADARVTDNDGQFGARVLSLGDLDGDGSSEVVVGVGESGSSYSPERRQKRAWVLPGSAWDGGSPSASEVAWALLEGPSPFEGLGAVGDVTGDGVPELFTESNYQLHFWDCASASALGSCEPLLLAPDCAGYWMDCRATLVPRGPAGGEAVVVFSNPKAENGLGTWSLDPGFWGRVWALPLADVLDGSAPDNLPQGGGVPSWTGMYGSGWESNSYAGGFHWAESGEALGTSLVALQDASGDGHADLLVGGPGSLGYWGDDTRGRVYLLAGPLADAP